MEIVEKKKVGRPLKYKNADELQMKVDSYFESLKTTNSDGEDVLKPPTISGLAYFLGFLDRQSIYDYNEREEFSCIIKRARLFIEVHWEENLNDNNATGSIFWLKNAGWKDKTEVDSKHTFTGEPVINFGE